MRIATVAAGLVPTIGYLHASRPGRLAPVYDLMEPPRPQVDQLGLGSVRSWRSAPKEFMLTSGGVCRVHPQLARLVVSTTVPTRAIHRFIQAVQQEMVALGV